MTNSRALPLPAIENMIRVFDYAKIFQILVVAGAAILISRLLHRSLNRLAERYAKRRILIKNFVPILDILLYAAAGYLILFGILELSQDLLKTLALSAGVAVGFAVKDLLANIFGGLVIIFTRAFNIGDKIRVGEHYGEVVHVSLLKVRIVTPDDSVISIPSKSFLEQSVSNANSGALDCQVVTEIFLPGNIDLKRIRQAALEAVYCSPYVYLEKPVVVNFQDTFKEMSLVQMKIKAYVYDHRFENRFSSDVYVRLKIYMKRARLIGEDFYSLPGSFPKEQPATRASARRRRP